MRPIHRSGKLVFPSSGSSRCFGLTKFAPDILLVSRDNSILSADHMKKFNVGVIGYGGCGFYAHIAAINATGRAQVVGVCSARALDSQELSARHGSPITVYRDLGRMLANPEIQVVSICSLSVRPRRDQAVAAARRGQASSSSRNPWR